MDDLVKLTDVLQKLAKADVDTAVNMKHFLGLLTDLQKALTETNRRIDSVEREMLRHWQRPYITPREID